MIRVGSELRLLMLFLCLAVSVFVWGLTIGARIDAESDTREFQANYQDSLRAKEMSALAKEQDAKIAAEAALRAALRQELSERISRLENERGDVFAWIATTREKIIAAECGIDPPPFPESMTNEE